jgi:hypothetical protein
VGLIHRWSGMLFSLYLIICAAGLHFFACLKRSRALAAQDPDRICHPALVGAGVSPRKKGGDSFFLPTTTAAQVGNGKTHLL